MITADEYAQITGELAPADFDACEPMACDIIHAHTLYAYVGRDIEALPDYIADCWKRAVALQVQSISQGGGIAALSEVEMNTVSLGRFSYSGGTGRAVARIISPAASALLPLLVAYGRGLKQCAPSL